jgi:hypothetical protein
VYPIELLRSADGTVTCLRALLRGLMSHTGDRVQIRRRVEGTELAYATFS